MRLLGQPLKRTLPSRCIAVHRWRWLLSVCHLANGKQPPPPASALNGIGAKEMWKNNLAPGVLDIFHLFDTCTDYFCAVFDIKISH